MNPSADRSVTIQESGRYGSVHYREPAGSLSFYWEFGGGDTVAIIQVDDAAAWKAQPSWIVGRRTEILRYVADEVIRQKAPSSRAQIDEETGCITLVQSTSSVPPASASGFSMSASRSLRTKLALGVLVVACGAAAAVWFKEKVLVIQSNTGAPVGLSVRTDDRIATLIQALEPYTPGLHRDASKDRYRMGLFLVPVDGRLRLTSRDRREVLEVDPSTLEATRAPSPRPSNKSPFAPTPDTYLSAGLYTAPTDDTYLNAAFLRVDGKSEPLRLADPAGALMTYTSAPGLKGTLMLARVNTTGNVLWKADTGIDRFKLAQILPGERNTAFVGTRPMVPDKVSEPLLVIVDNRTGKVATNSLWR